MDLQITITRTAIMAKVEGLTVMLSQHNPGVPFETLWASAGDQGKLDLYYKEAIGDLEDALKRWLKSSTAQFDLLAAGTDYTLKLSVSPNALVLTTLKGLFANKVQDYFVHAILSNWLSDLPEGTPVKPDYISITAADLTAIQDILLERDLDYGLGTRHDASDAAHADGDAFVLAQAKRNEDNDTVLPHNDWTDWANNPMPRN